MTVDPHCWHHTLGAPPAAAVYTALLQCCHCGLYRSVDPATAADGVAPGGAPLAQPGAADPLPPEQFLDTLATAAGLIARLADQLRADGNPQLAGCLAHLDHALTDLRLVVDALCTLPP